MGIINKWMEKKAGKSLFKRAVNLGESIKLEMYAFTENYFINEGYRKDAAGYISAVISNYVFNFGYISPIHEENKELLALCEAERVGVFNALGDAFKTNATGVLILLGAAMRTDITIFKSHMLLLSNEGFVKTGRETPDVSRDLPKNALVYMYEVASMNTKKKPTKKKSSL